MNSLQKHRMIKIFVNLCVLCAFVVINNSLAMLYAAGTFNNQYTNFMPNKSSTALSNYVNINHNNVHKIDN